MRALRINHTRDAGFSLVELTIALIIAVIIAGIAIPMYVNGNHQGGAAVVVTDGNVLAATINSMLSLNTTYGTTDGTISVDNSSGPATIHIALGAGATSPSDATERITSTTTASGVTYGNSVSWCLVVVNTTKIAVYNENGYQKGQTTCP